MFPPMHGAGSLRRSAFVALCLYIPICVGMALLYIYNICPRGLMVRILPFQGSGAGSIPVGGTMHIVHYIPRL